MTTATRTPTKTFIKTRDTCRMCGSGRLSLIWSFGETPLANSYVDPHQPTREIIAPLNVYHCADCHLTQLRDVVSPHVLFDNYLYSSSTSPVFRAHFDEYAEDIVSRFHLSYNSLVVDIGSNDGIFLQPLRNRGIKILGIEPAENVARIANKLGLTTVTEYFTREVAQKLQDIHGYAKVITANNVFAHTDDVHAFVEAVKILLDNKGVFVFEVQYLGDLIKKNLFDIVYHEHVCYYHLIPLITFFKQHDMTVFDIQRPDAHGGSLRVYVEKSNGPYDRTRQCTLLVAEERQAGLNTLATYKRFYTRIVRNKNKLNALLATLKRENKHIVGYGAPAKATTLCYTFGLTNEILDVIIDDSPMKQGMLMPGTHIPIVPSTYLYNNKPDVCLILAWNFAQPIMKTHEQYAKQGGRFIIPVPIPKML